MTFFTMREPVIIDQVNWMHWEHHEIKLKKDKNTKANNFGTIALHLNDYYSKIKVSSNLVYLGEK